MIKLPNGCKCSNLAVHPANYNKSSAKAGRKYPWYISYRFYDSSGKVKQIALRGMNEYTDLISRRDITIKIRDNEINHLLHGMNPITRAKAVFIDQAYEIHPEAPMSEALLAAYPKIKCAKHTKNAIKGVVGFFNTAARELSYDQVPLNEIKRRHVNQILERCRQTRQLTPGNFNHYRAYIMRVFKELLRLDAVESNPVKDIAKDEEVEKIRLTLSPVERKKVNKHLLKNHYTFWRYLHIFFHSGSRTSELFRLQGKDVNLKEQYFKKTVIKGNKKREVKSMIKNVALPHWKEIMKNCKPDDYVFAKNLQPGPVAIHPDQISKRWRKAVKKPLGIQADFYSVKHLHTDELADILSMDEARKHNSHTSKKTTLIYAVNEKERELERLKKVGNKFA